MGRCLRRTKRGIGRMVKSLGPVGMKLIGTVVGVLAETDLTNRDKRRLAVAVAKDSLKAAGIEARSTAIRAAVEVVVDALEDGAEALADFGEMDDGDLQELDIVSAS